MRNIELFINEVVIEGREFVQLAELFKIEPFTCFAGYQCMYVIYYTDIHTRNLQEEVADIEKYSTIQEANQALIDFLC